MSGHYDKPRKRQKRNENEEPMKQPDTWGNGYKEHLEPVEMDLNVKNIMSEEPINFSQKKNPASFCFNCGNSFKNSEVKFCGQCGQKRI